jgi:POT family proton-dependent oligopeptide transporter
MTDTVLEPAATPMGKTLGHPRGLMTLFFTEMWERFSYYGMRALLVLFMVDAVADGGLGFTDETATAIYGLYTAAVYLVALPGGWVADRLLGAQKAVWFGGIIIASGHFVLAIPTIQAFFLGLVLVVLGTGLLKPNISAIVADLYPEGGARRDAGFTIFYMGINMGAAIGPLVCSTLGENFDWHYGFAAAGVGMLLGLIQFRLTAKHLGAAGRKPQAHEKGHELTAEENRHHWLAFWIGVALIVLVVGAGLTGAITFDPVALAGWGTAVILGVAVAYFAYLFLLGGLDATEKKRTFVILILFLAAATFWSGFEQAGSTLNLFAERYTDRMIEALSFEVPAGWYQSLNAVFIIVFAPVFASIWVALARRNLDPSIPVKFGLGLVILGLGFAVMIFAARLVAEGGQAAPTWLMMTYLLHTFGELCLSPVGLSSVTKLAPKRFVGQMMGIWFLGASLGNLIAGLAAGRFRADAVEDMPALYLQIVLITIGSGLLLLVFSKPIRRMTGGIR